MRLTHDRRAMQTTKRGTLDVSSAPTKDELHALTSFSYKDPASGVRISFSKVYADNPDRATAWMASVSRSVGERDASGKARSTSWTVYAGTDNTLPRRFDEVLSKIKDRVQAA